MNTPSARHPDLAPERLQFIGRIILEIWEGAAADQKWEAGDGPLTMGVRFFERLLARIRELSRTIPWLRVIERGMHFVFAFGAIPLRALRGKVKVLKPRYAKRNDAELLACKLAFPGLQEELDYCYRIVLELLPTDEKDAAGRVKYKPRVLLAKYHVEAGTADDVVDMLSLEQVSADPKIIGMLPPPVEPAKPKVGSKRKPDSAANDS